MAGGFEKPRWAVELFDIAYSLNFNTEVFLDDVFWMHVTKMKIRQKTYLVFLFCFSAESLLKHLLPLSPRLSL